MAIRGAGASFKLAHPTTGVLTEVAVWLNDIGGDASTDELDGTVFTPGSPLADIVDWLTEALDSREGAAST